MTGHIQVINTRFRAYQIGQAGASYSYMAGNNFTLIEAVATDINKETIKHELNIQSRSTIDTLHITSWDSDHCSPNGLEWILENLKPERIEYPGYEPHTDRAKECLKLIESYKAKRLKSLKPIKLQKVDPEYVLGLNPADGLGYNNIFYHPKNLVDSSNDNSTVKFFRTGAFNVLSLGDVESHDIGAMLRRCRILCRETDVMILAHHGADNGITTKKFLSHLNPSVGICTSNYDNQYEHPGDDVKQLFYDKGIRLFTTKTGDVVIQSVAPHTREYEVINYKANSTEISSRKKYVAKKANLLASNGDAIRNRYDPGFKRVPPKRFV